MTDSATLRNSPLSVRALLLILLIAAAALGLYGRFTGLGFWPLGVDEFYISRSVDNILRFGIPRFPCGGYYTRGLVYQYAVAGLRLMGGSTELDTRLLAALSSLGVLPAVYLLARRLGGAGVAWICVIILGVSIWEIEMARFGRMYAPFQAVFVWYVVFFLYFVVDGRKGALPALAALSLLGVLTWEGGVLLGAANLLAVLLTHRDGRLEQRHYAQLAALGVLLALEYLLSRDLRGFAGPPPDDHGTTSAGDAAAEATGVVGRFRAWLLPTAILLPGLALLVAPIGLLISAWPWLRIRAAQRPLSLAALTLAAIAAALHAVTLAVGVLVLAYLSNLLTRQDLAQRGAGRYLASILAFALVWTIVFARLPHALVLKSLIGFPDFWDEVMRPWGRTVPRLALGLAGGVGYWLWRSSRGEAAERDMTVLLALLVALLLGVGAAGTERLETRYTFFLYPLVVILAVMAICRLGERARLPAVAVLVLPLASFAASEDFSLRHIARIDSAPVNFRLGMSPAIRAHLYPRNDMRGAARWLDAHTNASDLIVTGVPNLTAYEHNVGRFYLGVDDDRYDAYVCADGRTERWSGLPVVYGDDALDRLLQSGRPLYVVMYSDFERALETPKNLARWSIRPVWTSDFGDTTILRIDPKRKSTES